MVNNMKEKTNTKRSLCRRTIGKSSFDEGMDLYKKYLYNQPVKRQEEPIPFTELLSIINGFKIAKISNLRMSGHDGPELKTLCAINYEEIKFMINIFPNRDALFIELVKKSFIDVNDELEIIDKQTQPPINSVW